MHFKFAMYAVMNLVATAVVHHIDVVRFVECAIEGIA
jgi:hypothetical protein